MEALGKFSLGLNSLSKLISMVEIRRVIGHELQYFRLLYK